MARECSGCQTYSGAQEEDEEYFDDLEYNILRNERRSRRKAADLLS